MYFEEKDIDFLKSVEFKKYKQIQQKLSYSSFYEDKRITILFIIASLISLIIVLNIFNFQIPNWSDIIKIYQSGHIFRFIIGIIAIIGFLWMPITFFVLMAISILLSIFDGIYPWFLKQFIYKKSYTSPDNRFEIFEKKINNLITSYISKESEVLIDKLTHNNSYESFNTFKNEFVENYIFIKTAYNYIGYIKGVREFLTSAKAIIETVYFYNPNTQGPLEKIETKIYETPKPESIERTSTKLDREKPKYSKNIFNRIIPKKRISETNIRHNKNEKLSIPVLPTKTTVTPALIDWNEINAKKKNIGDSGELIVFNFEIQKLIKYDLIELVPMIEHASIKYGDSIGYDIKSFNEKGQSIFIEVKSTEGPLTNSVFFTKNEINKMELLSDSYYLYRVYNLDRISQNADISIYAGHSSIKENFEFSTESVRATLK